MTSTQNPRKSDPPPSPIHKRPQSIEIWITPPPLIADADVHILVTTPRLSKKSYARPIYSDEDEETRIAENVHFLRLHTPIHFGSFP